jgi:TolB protein
MFKFRFSLLLAGLISFLSSCGQTMSWKGKFIYEHSSDINEYDLSSKKDRMLFQKGIQPYLTASGEIYYINDAFPKGKSLVRKRTSGGQFRDVLDMSNENPDYKQALDEYSVIRGTGISAVFSSMSDPKVSPDGKYLSLTVFGYKGQGFEKNCVAVFDIATRKLVTKFEGKYYGNWLPDGRLLMSGWHKAGSVDGSIYKGPEPGIFLADASLGNVKRIDKDLDDPAPYHALPSPDGKRVAFILNNHVWVMNIDGSDARQLTDVDRDNVETYPCWSPDSKQVACWAYKTFERSYYTAIAIVPASAKTPVVLSDKAAVWPRDPKGYRVSGGAHQFSWR